MRVAAAVAMVAAAGAHAEYRVSAFKQVPGFQAIMGGDYDVATEAASGWTRTPGFAVESNRCISLLMTEALTEALSSCNRALRELPAVSAVSAQARRANESVVLSNRGVVLAMQGDLVAAEEDFARALKLDDENGNAETNLNHVRSLRMSMR